MNAKTEAGWPPPRTGGEHAIREWLDALASGRCSESAFLWEMQERFKGDQDRNWEGLSLLDEYLRRGKIKKEIFDTVKSRLQSATPQEPIEPAVPTLRSQTSKIVTAPASVAPPGEARSRTRAGVKMKPRPAKEVGVGDVLRDRYRIEEVLGHGGMGSVFAATDDYRLDLPSTGRRIAIKVLHTTVTMRDELLVELQREFQHLQLLSHPNIVRVHEFDRDGDIAFFTMELLTGALLSRVLAARNGIALQQHYALAIIRGVGAAVAHAHSRGVVHGDVNPQNVFITEDGEIRVLDFGASHRMLQASASSGAMTGLTPLVTPGYASCQLLEGQIPDSRDDLFALACTAYLLLAGEHPFPNLSAVEARNQRVKIRRPPNLTPGQWTALRQSLEWEREDRPIDVLQWLDQIDPDSAVYRLPAVNALTRTPPPRRRRTALVAVACVAVILLAAAGYWAITDADTLSEHAAAWSEQGRAAATEAGATIAGWFNSGRRTTPVVNTQTAAPIADRVATEPPVPPRIEPPAAIEPPSAVDATPPIPRPPAAVVSPHVAALPEQRSAAAPESHAAAAANPGSTRIEMAADTLDVPSSENNARVIVRRKGSNRGDAAFTWWTESGTAKPGVDFGPVTPHQEHVPNGSAATALNVKVADHPRSQPKSFYVVIDQAESGPALGARNLTLVTILPSE